jgi:enoyl-CoA hydratase
MSAAEQLAKKIAANGPVAVALAIEAVDNGYHGSTEDALRLEANLFGLLASTQDMREGMGAFLEKRKANFSGR